MRKKFISFSTKAAILCSLLMAILISGTSVQAEDNPGNNIMIHAYDKEGKDLKDAEFAIYAYGNYVSDDIVYEDKQMIGKASTDESGVIYSPKLPEGIYIIKQLNVPSDYITDDTLHYVSVTKGKTSSVTFYHNGNKKEDIDVVIDVLLKSEVTLDKGILLKGNDGDKEFLENKEYSIEAHDGEASLNMSVIDESNGSPVADANVEIRNENNKVIANWKSQNVPSAITGLEADKEYTVSIEVPDGFVKFADEKIIAENNGSYIFKIKPIKVKVALFDATDKTLLSGGKITLSHEKTKKKFVFTSSKDWQEFTHLPVGDYLVSQSKTPHGYLPLSEGKVVVEDKDTVQKLSFYNERTKGRIKITVKDSDNNPIKGASFNIKTAKTYVEGQSASEAYKTSIIVETVKTDKEGVAYTSDLDVYSYKNAEPKDNKVYFVEQKSSVKGCTPTSKVYKVVFEEVNKKEGRYEESISVKNRGTTATAESKKDSSDKNAGKTSGNSTGSSSSEQPKNGVSGNIQTGDLYGVLMGILAIIIVLCIVYLKKSKKDNSDKGKYIEKDK